MCVSKADSTVTFTKREEKRNTVSVGGQAARGRCFPDTHSALQGQKHRSLPCVTREGMSENLDPHFTRPQRRICRPQSELWRDTELLFLTGQGHRTLLKLFFFFNQNIN